MHPTALRNSAHFFETYAGALQIMGSTRVIDVGAQDVNGSLRSTCPPAFQYIGVDFVAGKGVDVVLEDPYALPFPDASADIVLSSSCFEHSEMFWLLYLEVMRVLKPHGLLYLNVPSNGDFHRWPVDCWRFYPDSGQALVTWAQRNGMDAMLLESYTSTQDGDQWNDFVAVFLKSAAFAHLYPRRIVERKEDIFNGLSSKSDEFLHYSVMPEDKKKLTLIGQVVQDIVKVV